MKQNILVIVLALLFAACEMPVKRTIEIVAQDKDGKPVAHARVYLQGSYQGETNDNGVFLKDTVIAGDLSLGVIVHNPATNVKVPRTIFVRAGTPGIITDTVMIPEPPLLFTFVTIKSEPSGANVSINDIDIGRTPLTDTIPMGEHHFRVASPDGKRTMDSTLALDQPTVEIEFKFPPPPVLTGGLEIITIPPGGTVYLDDRRVGETPFSKQVKYGKHHVRVVHDNGEADEWVMVEKEKTVRSYSFPDIMKDLRVNVSKEEADIAQQFELAQSHFGAKRWHEAEQGFSSILGKKDYYASAYFYRGLARFQQKKYPEALEDFKKTLEFRDQILVGERDKVIQLLEYYRALTYKNMYDSEQNEEKKNLYREEAIYEFETYLKDFGMQSEYKDFVANANMFLTELKEAE
jgi:hypothetical protein